MPIHNQDPLAPQEGTETPKTAFQTRRTWLRRVGFTAGLSVGGGLAYWWWNSTGDEEVIAAGRSKLHQSSAKTAHPAPLDERYEYGRAETVRAEAARYTNFYEFSRFKSCWRYVDLFEPYPWKIEIRGLCRNPLTLDLDEFFRRYLSDFRERQYRHRCVERWAMAVPWTGIPLHRLLRDADPLPAATHVRFVSFNRPDQAPNQGPGKFPWPYVEGLELAEAMHDLTFVATGVYGEPLLKQHGAPLRIVVPWKYGYKSPKSVQVIELVDSEPKTFWTTLNPTAYPFQSNVDPGVSRPWNQREERMLGTNETFPTQYLNGYEAQIGDLYT